MVEIELHGILGEKIKKSKWTLAVNSVGEAVRAIEANTNALYKNLYELDKENIKYRILINKKDFKIFKNQEDIKNDFEKVVYSNLSTIYKDNDLQSIDIVPILEGCGQNFLAIGALIAGVALAFTGVGLALTGIIGFTLAASLVVAGIGLAAAGFLSLLSSPPPFVAPEFASPNTQSKAGGNKSYLFDGPTNVNGEGGPIPIGYGTVLVGSKSISATFNTNYVDNSSTRTS
jgi:predicted phage tail protein